jgi:hypothetical protein
VTSFLAIAGIGCIVLAPALVIASFVALWRLGRSVRARNPELWESMRPGLYGSRMLQQTRSERMKDFLDGREYESFNDPALNRLVRAYVFCGRGAAVAMVGAVVTVIWACWGS